MSDKSCYDCRHAKGNKFYEFFCHYKLIGAFCEHGKPVDCSYVCENFDYHDEDKIKMKKENQNETKTKLTPKG